MPVVVSVIVAMMVVSMRVIVMLMRMARRIGLFSQPALHVEAFALRIVEGRH